MSVKDIGGPGAGPPVTAGPEPAAAPAGKAAPSGAFREIAGIVPAGAPSPAVAGDLESVVARTIGAVRDGSLAPEKALDAILEGSREILASGMPRQVDIQETLDYIREILESDPTFLELLEGGETERT